MAIDIRLINIVSPNEFALSYKSGVTIGDLYNGFIRYPDTGTTYSGGTTGITISGVNFDYGQQYWIKIEDKTNGSFIIENINVFNAGFFVSPNINCVSPTPSGTPITPTPTPTITLTPTNTSTPLITPSNTMTQTPTITITPSITPTITPSNTPAPSQFLFKQFENICAGGFCYMPISVYNYYVGLYGASFFQVNDKFYDSFNHANIYKFIGDYILYNNNPSCVLNYVTKTTDPCAVYYAYYTIEYVYRVGRWTENYQRTVSNVNELTYPYINRFYSGNNGIEDCVFKVLSYSGIDIEGNYLITYMYDPGEELISAFPGPDTFPPI